MKSGKGVGPVELKREKKGVGGGRGGGRSRRRQRHVQAIVVTLVAPYRAILRYYRCDTPYRAILVQGG